jgi:hypothetical protein
VNGLEWKMMKAKSLVMILILLASCFVVAMPRTATAKPDNQFYVDPDPCVGHIEASIMVSVMIDSVADLVSYEFEVVWNKNVLLFSNITWGWLEEPNYPTMKLYSIQAGSGLLVSEWFGDISHSRSVATPVSLVNITWTVMVGGYTWINFTDTICTSPMSSRFPPLLMMAMSM